MAEKNAIQFNEASTGEQEFFLQYQAEPTASRFHNSNAPVRLIKGPEGSGKSSACVIEILLRAMKQRPYKGRPVKQVRRDPKHLSCAHDDNYSNVCWLDQERDYTNRGYRFTLKREAVAR